MTKKGIFSYESFDGKSEKQSDYFYDESWFTESAETLSPGLRLMSLDLAMACFPVWTPGDPEVRTHGEELLSELEYKDITVNEDYRKPPTEDSLGLIAAHKKITGKGSASSFSLIVLTFRGASFGPEWAKNIILGESGDAEGFASITEKTKAFLQDYLKKVNDELLPEKKFWITGYSRAAAIAGLIGANITENPKDYGTTPGSVFVYTFESPMAIDSGRKRSFRNIHNTINPDDLVPRLAPKPWGFCRPGIDDTILPKKNSPLWYEKIREVKDLLSKDSPALAAKMTGFQPYCIFDNAVKPLKGLDFPLGKKESFFRKAIRMDQTTFLNTYGRFMATRLTLSAGMYEERTAYRKAFVSSYQKSFSFCAMAYLGAPVKKRDALRSCILEMAKLLDIFSVKAILYLKLKYGGNAGIKNVENEITNEVIKQLKKDPVVALKDEEVKPLKAHIHPLVHYFIYCASADIRHYRGFFTLTFMNNMWRILACHAPETTLAWLKVLDEGT